MRLIFGVRWFLALAVLAVPFAGPAALAQDKDDPIVAFAKAHVKEPNKPFTLVVIVKVKDGANAKFEAAFAKAQVATRKEKGCLTYDLNRDTEGGGARYVVYERWKSLADLEKHLRTDHIKTLLEVLREILDGMPELRILIPVGD
jgi:quinol monooxygenase YgiN